jgi:acyl transferase domain-containing protein/acyl carrier protein
MGAEQAYALAGMLRARLAALLGIPGEAIDARRRFRDYGLTSGLALDLIAALSRELGRPLPPTLAWDHPDLDALARHLAGEDERAAVASGPAYVGEAGEPIAVIGLACRLPSAPDAEAFWRVMADGIDAIREVPAERWSLAAYFDPDRRAPGKMNTRWGGFLDGIDRFDPEAFGITPREAAQIDPQQRLMLELAWEALEDAGIAADRLRDSRTGVYCGAMTQDYARIAGDGGEAIDEYSATGQDTSIIAARISYGLGLQGPSLTVNTACSSSLVAVHLACQSLRTGESTLAIAGGVNAVLAPESTIGMTKFGGLSPDGRSRAFDARANGYVRAEGAGAVVLKRLSRALADGDPIWCVIRGSAVNNDGFSNGLTAPNPRAQEAVLRMAYADAGVAPGAVQYVEAHGTGTALGDPIEAHALGAVLGRGRRHEDALAIGSVKTNIGHLEAAAGIAGLIKLALAIRRAELPGNLHFEQPNPHIAFAELGVRVQAARTAWPRPDEPMVAGVSSFGFGGTNCHVVVGEPPLRAQAEAALRALESQAPARGPRVFVFSGNGSQWRGMARQLIQASPVFRARVAMCDRAIAPLVGGRWRRGLLDELCAEPGPGELGVEVEQPLLFAIQLGLAAVLDERGYRPDAVIGHSLGEVAAACVAGVLELADAARVVVLRSRLQAPLAELGAMALVACGPDEAAAGLPPGVAIAAVNAPRQTVLSGAAHALDAALAALAARGVTARRLRVNVAYHSPQMDGARDELPRRLAGLVAGAPRIPMRSTVTGDWLAAGEAGPDYWGRNLRDPVRFADGIARLRDAGYRCFVELSPHPILTEAVRACGAEVVAGTLHRERDPAESLSAAIDALGAAPAAIASPVIVPVSAHSRAAVLARAAAWADEPAPLDALAYTAAVRRSHRAARIAVVGDDLAEIRARLASASPRDLGGGERGPVFVFPGQGGQWAGMGRRLLDDPRMAGFGHALEACDHALAAHVPWSVVARLRAGAPLDDIDVVQPALFAIQVALVALWRSLGIAPAVVIGQSMGEVAAACAVGALDLEAGARVICVRSRLMRALRGRGAMAVVALGRAEAAEVLRGREHALSVAVASSPRSTVIAGDPAALDDVLRELAARNVYAQRVQVDVASHSPQVDPILDELRAALADLVPGAPSPAMRSTVTGEAGPTCDADYWVNNLRDPVELSDAIQALIAEGYDRFVEIGPHPVALRSIEDGLRHAGRDAIAIASLHRDRDDRRSVLDGLAALYEAGSTPAWDALFPAGGHIAALPAYPWQRRSFWLDARRPRTTAADAPDAWFTGLTWRATTIEAGDPAGTWLIYGGATDALAEALRRRGATAVIATAETLASCVQRCDALRGVIDATALDGAAPDEPGALVGLAAAAAHRIAAALAAVTVRPGARLWLATHGAQAAGDAGPSAAGVGHAPVWGIGRVAALEQPASWGGLIDLDPRRTAAAQADLVAQAVLDGRTEEDQRAMRGDAQLVARLVPRPPAAGPALALRADAAYLITGGFGAIGAPLCRWLIDHGARHLAIVSRRGDAAGALAELTARGAEVSHVRVDVADEPALAAAIAELTAVRPLAGVFHAAGALRYARLDALDDDRTLLAAKIAGAWALHRRTAGLDHFVMFSSAAAVWGALGMAHYAAANHALDALAQLRRRAGQAALVVNWGLWAGDGLGAQDGGQMFGEAGVAAMPAPRALAALGRAIAGGAPQVTIADVDWPRFAAMYQARRTRAIVAELAPASEAAIAPSQPALRATLDAAPPGRRRDLLQRHVHDAVAGALGLDAGARVQPDAGFFRIGMTSLIAVELGRRLSADLGCRLPSTLTFDHPSVLELTEYLLAMLAPAIAPPVPAAPPTLDADPDSLSEAVLVAMLAARLGAPPGSPRTP